VLQRVARFLRSASAVGAMNIGFIINLEDVVAVMQTKGCDAQAPSG
jgi:hypothetical protein